MPKVWEFTVMLKCPNNCGFLTILKKPSQVFIDIDVFQSLSKEQQERAVFCTLIHSICPICGYYENTELTEKQWQKYNEKNVEA